MAVPLIQSWSRSQKVYASGVYFAELLGEHRVNFILRKVFPCCCLISQPGQIFGLEMNNSEVKGSDN